MPILSENLMRKTTWNYVHLHPTDVYRTTKKGGRSPSPSHDINAVLGEFLWIISHPVAHSCGQGYIVRCVVEFNQPRRRGGIVMKLVEHCAKRVDDSSAVHWVSPLVPHNYRGSWIQIKGFLHFLMIRTPYGGWLKDKTPLWLLGPPPGPYKRELFFSGLSHHSS